MIFLRRIGMSSVDLGSPSHKLGMLFQTSVAFKLGKVDMSCPLSISGLLGDRMVLLLGGKRSIPLQDSLCKKRLKETLVFWHR